MIRKLFNKKEEPSKTGIYIYQNRDLIELTETPEKGSVNSIIEHLGLFPNQAHIVFTFDSKKIECLGFKIFSKEVLFVLAKDKKKKISENDISSEVRSIDWQFEYSSINVEDILNNGIEEQNLSLDFLSKELDLVQEGTDLYRSNKYDLFLQFENHILKAFSSSEWDNAASKWLKGVNKEMYTDMLDEAKVYHQNEQEAIEEVNVQANSLRNIPEAINNEFISLHTKPNGNINFYNLLIVHYTQECDLDEFILMNKGRFKKIDERGYEVGNFIYEFNDLNELETVYSK